MANEIYDSTWWGNTIDTASSIGTSTEMIQGQFNLTKIGDEEVTNGDFATDSDWTKGSGTTISDGKLNLLNVVNRTNTIQLNVTTIGKIYKVSYEVSNYIQGGFRILLGNTVLPTITSNGVYTDYVTATSSTYVIIQAFDGTPTTLSIDNVSVKQVRATTVEAVKCLADTIHRIGLQDIQN